MADLPRAIDDEAAITYGAAYADVRLEAWDGGPPPSGRLGRTVAENRVRRNPLSGRSISGSPGDHRLAQRVPATVQTLPAGGPQPGHGEARLGVGP
ncbi:hypothetical protein [Nonomuraea sp. NPDC049480]|uniref:hypothetical protein n=1 Tax=Nonomuraea sp. NPDC049480 TaxID=3364353 RepID=UPI003789CDFB